MPKKSEVAADVDEVRREIKSATGSSTDQKLDLIVTYLHQMNRRDRLRTIGSAIHGTIAFVYLGIFLWSLWYFAAHGTDLLKQITEMSVKSAAGMTQTNMMDQFNQYIGKPKQ